MLSAIIAFVLATLGALVVAGSLGVGVLHYKAWRKVPVRNGLVPFHVWTISLAHVTTSLLSLFYVLTYMTPLTASVYALGTTLTLAAFFIIGKYQYTKVRSPEVNTQIIRMS